MLKAESPFLIVNPKSYLYGAKSLELARAADEAAADTGLQIYFTCSYADIRMIREQTRHIIVCAQSMDPLEPGRGMGRVLPESLKEAGADALFLNHAENPKTVSDLYASVRRAKELDMITIVCADSTVEAKAAACMNPDIVLAEPTELIGTGQVADDAYTVETVEALRKINPQILVMIASGVSTAEDCYRVVKLGADGTGATSGILNAPSPAVRIREMAEAIVRAKEERAATVAGQIEILRKEEIEKALSHCSRQYLTGDLKLPQPLRFLPDKNVESGISSYPCYKWEQPHYHTTTSEYCYILSGETKYVDLSRGKEYHFKEGDFYVLRPNTPYLQKCMAGCRLLFLKAPAINDKVSIPVDDRMHAWCWEWEKGW